MSTQTTETARTVQEEQQLRRRWLRIIILLLILLLLLLLFAGGAYAHSLNLFDLFRKKPSGVVLEPDYPSMSMEFNAEKIIGDDDGEKLEAPTGGGSVEIVFSGKVVVNRGNQSVNLYYENPARSTQNVVVQVIVDAPEEKQYLLAQSGILEPGYRVSTLDMNGDDVTLSPGGYDGRLKLLFYDPETGERAVVDTDIPVTIEVI